MAEIRIEVNAAGVQALLKSDEVLALLEAKGNRIAAAGGEGMEVTSRIGRTRARVSVITATRAARKAEAVDRALTKAIDAGRG